MTQLELKNHQVWQDLITIVENIDSNALAREHLEACDYKVCGYWDEQDVFYEEVILPRTLETQLLSSSIGFTGKERFLQLKFSLQTTVAAMVQLNPQIQKVGELVLIYDENLEFLDERWLLDVDSPLLKMNVTEP